MTTEFHGNDAESHDGFQEWRRTHPDGYILSESSPGKFIIHYAQDRRENPGGRGCMHLGCSDNGYLEDKGGCYTSARKVCCESLRELLEWAGQHGHTATSCKHCDTVQFPFSFRQSAGEK